MVDEPDEGRAHGHGGGLRDGQGHLEDGVGAALEVGRRAALKQRDGADDDPGQAGAEDERQRLQRQKQAGDQVDDGEASAEGI